MDEVRAMSWRDIEALSDVIIEAAQERQRQTELAQQKQKRGR